MPFEECKWYSLETFDAVESLLRQQEIIGPGESLRKLTVAGEGNMNVTLRAQSSASSVIVKQARPFVAKYDFIPAPLERAGFEASFYAFCAKYDQLSRRMPKLLRWVAAEHLLILEDVGNAPDATDLYTIGGQPDSNPSNLPDILPTLLDWLRDLHTVSRDSAELINFNNVELRRLNHSHIFEIPFQDPAAIELDHVCPGMSSATTHIRKQVELISACADLGQQYLSNGVCLLHGDFYPGSWLHGASGPHVIDPEFCFAGPPEFDYGVLVAHLRLAGYSNANDQIRTYVEEQGTALNVKLTNQFAAVEILRRLLGVAQLPLILNLDSRVRLIEESAATLLELR